MDTKFNKYRGASSGSGSDGQHSASNVAQFRKMYQKRRIQLLQGSKPSSENKDDVENDSVDVRKNINYLQILSFHHWLC